LINLSEVSNKKDKKDFNKDINSVNNPKPIIYEKFSKDKPYLEMKDDKKNFNENKYLENYSNQNKKVNGVVLNFKEEKEQRNFIINPASVNNNNDKKVNRNLFEIDSKTPKIELKKNIEKIERKYSDKKEPEKKDSEREREREKQDDSSKYEKK